MTLSTLKPHWLTAVRALRLTGVFLALVVAVLGVQSVGTNQSAAFFQSLLTAPSNEIQTGTWQPPDAPLFWVEENNTQVEVSWQTSPGATSYRVYRSADNVTFNLIQTVTLPSLSYLDTGLTNQTPYYYKVTAVTLGGIESPPAAIVAKWAQPEDIVIDDAAMTSDVGNSGTVTASPGWDLYQVGMGGFAASVLQNAAGGDNYSTNASATGQTYRWQPNTSLTGNYEVYIQYICDGSRGNASYDIYANNIKITSSSIVRDQSKLDGLTGPDCGSQASSSVSGPQWVHLADIASNNQTVMVQLTATSGEAYILADAVAFRRTGDLTPAQILAFSAPAAPGLTVTNSPTTPVEEHIQNGSFETTSTQDEIVTTSNWAVTGAVQNLTQQDAATGKLAPTDGERFVMIGAGAAGQHTVSSISQTFSAGVRNLGFDLKVLTTQDGKLDPTQKITVFINDRKLISVSPAELELSTCSTAGAKYCSDWRHINLYLGDYTDSIQTLAIYVDNSTSGADAQTWVAIDDVTTTDLVVNGSAVFNLTQSDLPGVTTWYQLGEDGKPTQGEQFQLNTQPKGGWVKYWSQNMLGEKSAIQTFTVKVVTGSAHDPVTLDAVPFTSVELPPVTPTASATLPLQIDWNWQSASRAAVTVNQVATTATELNYQLQYQHLVEGQSVTEMLQGTVPTQGLTQVTLPNLFFGTCSGDEESSTCVAHESLSQIQLLLQSVTEAISPAPATEIQQATYSATVSP